MEAIFRNPKQNHEIPESRPKYFQVPKPIALEHRDVHFPLIQQKLAQHLTESPFAFDLMFPTQYL